MSVISRYSKLFLVLALAACFVWLPNGLTSAQNASTELVEYASGSEDVILELYQTYEIIDPKPKPRFTLYGDGRVQVYFPPFMKRAGTYELNLSVDEMEELLLYLSSRGVFSFDTAKAKGDKKAKLQARAQQARQGVVQVTHRSDETRTTLRSHLSSYTPATAGAKSVLEYTKEIRWQGLQNDAKDHPNLTSITNLAEAEATLLDYCSDAKLKKIK